MTSDADRVVLLVTPPPTPNGPMHVGHLSGPYVAGDIAARALRSSGRRALTQCGLDSHQNYVLARGEAAGEPGEQAASRFGQLIRQALAAARIEYDIMVDPLADNDYRQAVGRLLTELVETKVVEVAPTRLSACGDCGRILHHVRVAGRCPACGAGAAGGTCEGCGSFLTAADLVDASSTCCAAAPEPVERVVPVLRLEEHRERLCEFWSRATLPARLRRLVASLLDRGLPEVPLAYPSDWGIEWRANATAGGNPAGDALRIDVWAEMALANLYLPARQLRPGVRSVGDCVAAWSAVEENWLFLGIDNAFYYAVMIPALHFAAGLPERPTGLVVNEFYRLSGAKFSTSRNHAIWAHEWLAQEDAGVVRAYVSWDRPDSYESDFTMAAFTAFRDRYLAACQGVGGELPTELADIELTRAEQALNLDAFAPAVVVRAALAAAGARPERAARLLALVAGTG